MAAISPDASATKTMIFLTGYSGSGKSTVAAALAAKLASSVVLDGDQIRKAYGDLPHGVNGLEANTKRLIDLAVANFKSNKYVISAFVAPKALLRESVKKTISSQGIRFVEVFIDASLDECKKRDPKKLYERHQKGEHILLAGVNETYDIPQAPDITCNSGTKTIQESISQILSKI